MEGLPAGPEETLEHPCDKWFCNPTNMKDTHVYAARFTQVILFLFILYACVCMYVCMQLYC